MSAAASAWCAERYSRARGAGRSHTGETVRVLMSRRTAVLLVLAGLWPLLVWPNFVRVIATDERAFEDGPTAYLVVHVTLAAVSMAFGVLLVVLGVRGLRSAGRSEPA